MIQNYEILILHNRKYSNPKLIPLQPLVCRFLAESLKMMTVDEKDVEGAGHVKVVVVDHEKRFDGV